MYLDTRQKVVGCFLVHKITRLERTILKTPTIRRIFKHIQQICILKLSANLSYYQIHMYASTHAQTNHTKPNQTEENKNDNNNNNNNNNKSHLTTTLRGNQLPNQLFINIRNKQGNKALLGVGGATGLILWK